MDKIQEIRDRLEELVQTRMQLVQKADAESRDLTDDERKVIADSTDQFKSLSADLEDRVRLEEDLESLRQPQSRKTTPDAPANQPEDQDDEEAPADAAPKSPARQPQMRGSGRDREPARAADSGARNKWGWQNFGYFAAAVRNASINGGHVDTRLTAYSAPTTYGNEGAGADGGYAVPPDFRAAIMSKVLGEDSLLGRTDDYTTSGNSFTVPMDASTPWGTDGVQANWTGEGAQKTQSKPVLEQVTTKLHKLVSLVPVTDELLEDAPALDTYLRRKVPEKMDFAINLALLQGTGVGQPLGILDAPGTVSVAKEGSQAADTVNFENITNMWARMYAPCRRNAAWYINQDVEPQLQRMFFKAEAGDTSGIPVYLPSNSLSGSPYATLLGRPVIPTEAANELGSKGDIILADLSKYMTVRKTAGPRSDVSIHLWFDYDVTAYRFVFRLGGQPWWNAPIARRAGSNTLSCFVTLDERA